jgi:hypothetical protein
MKNTHGSCQLAALLLLTSVGCSVHAAVFNEQFLTVNNDAILAAEAQITNLRMTLVDLDPNDGVTPSIQFIAGSRPYSLYDMMTVSSGVMDAAGFAQEVAQGRTPTVGSYGLLFPNPAFPSADTSGLVMGAPGSTYSTWLPTNGIESTSADGVNSASLSASGLSVSTRVSAEQLSSLKQPAYTYIAPGDNPWELEGSAISGTGVGGGYGVDMFDEIDPITGAPISVFRLNSFAGDLQSLSNAVYNPGNAWPLGQSFLLSPNTQVIFEGTQAIQTVTNLESPLLDGVTVDGGRVTNSASTSVMLYRDQPKDGQSGWPTNEAVLAAYDMQWVTASAGYGFASEGGESATSDFSLSLSNTGSVVTKATLDMYVTSTYYLQGSAAVPEPATWVFMLGGLLGLCVIKRRHSA